MEENIRLQGEIDFCVEKINYYQICIKALKDSMKESKLALKRWKREQKRRKLRKIKKKLGPKGYENHKKKTWKQKAKRRVVRWEKRKNSQSVHASLE